MLSLHLLQAAAEYVLSAGASAWAVASAAARDVLRFAEDHFVLIVGLGALALIFLRLVFPGRRV